MKYVKALVVIFLLVCLDQYTKSVVLSRLALGEYHPILGDIFGLFYLENKGMAWGMFQNKQMIFLIFTVFVLVILGYCYVRLQKESKFFPLNLCILFLIAGAIGNMIDRIFHGEVLFQGAVVDFLYFKLIDFPVFNMADMYVTISLAIAILLFIFRYKETDFEKILFGKNEATSEKTRQKSDANQRKAVGEPPITSVTGEGSTDGESVDIDSLFLNEEEEDD